MDHFLSGAGKIHYLVLAEFACYAKFEVHEPPVNFTLNENSAATGPSDQTQHYGIQVKDTDTVAAAQKRLESAGLGTAVEDGVTCCYAVQDKVWVTAPDGEQWEYYTVLTDAERMHSDDSADACCASEPAQPACC